MAGLVGIKFTPAGSSALHARLQASLQSSSQHPCEAVLPLGVEEAESQNDLSQAVLLLLTLYPPSTVSWV